MKVSTSKWINQKQHSTKYGILKLCTWLQILKKIKSFSYNIQCLDFFLLYNYRRVNTNTTIMQLNRLIVMTIFCNQYSIVGS